MDGHLFYENTLREYQKESAKCGTQRNTYVMLIIMLPFVLKVDRRNPRTQIGESLCQKILQQRRMEMMLL